ncbi:MAG: hypothetical protein ACFNUL_10410, partial [Cardiobacterium hominis]
NNQNDDENGAAAEEKGERWGHGYAPWWLKLPLIVLRGLRECHVQTAKNAKMRGLSRWKRQTRRTP